MREVEIYKYYPEKDREELETIDTRTIKNVGYASGESGAPVYYGVDDGGIFGYFVAGRYKYNGKLSDRTRVYLKHRINRHFKSKKEQYEREGV